MERKMVKLLIHINGNKQMEAFYKNGELEGVLKRWHPNNILESTANYKDGKLDGKVETFG